MLTLADLRDSFKMRQCNPNVWLGLGLVSFAFRSVFMNTGEIEEVSMNRMHGWFRGSQSEFFRSKL